MTTDKLTDAEIKDYIDKIEYNTAPSLLVSVLKGELFSTMIELAALKAQRVGVESGTHVIITIDVLEQIDRLAVGGLCSMSFGGARAFLEDARAFLEDIRSEVKAQCVLKDELAAASKEKPC